MPAWVEGLRDGTRGDEEPLGVPGGLQPQHAALSPAGGLVRILGTVVQVPVLAVLHAREDPLLRGAIAFQLVGDDDPRHVGQPLEQLTEKLLRGLLMRRRCTSMSSTWPSWSTALQR